VFEKIVIGGLTWPFQEARILCLPLRRRRQKTGPETGPRLYKEETDTVSAKLQTYKRRMGWTFPWASSFGSDFNSDFNVLIQAATAQASQGPAMARAFRSLQDLKNAIHRFLADTNANPKPFVWTKDPDKIIAAVKRGHQVLDSIH
jgi:hypothetical protein